MGHKEEEDFLVRHKEAHRRFIEVQEDPLLYSVRTWEDLDFLHHLEAIHFRERDNSISKIEKQLMIIKIINKILDRDNKDNNRNHKRN